MLKSILELSPRLHFTVKSQQCNYWLDVSTTRISNAGTLHSRKRHTYDIYQLWAFLFKTEKHIKITTEQNNTIPRLPLRKLTQGQRHRSGFSNGHSPERSVTAQRSRCWWCPWSLQMIRQGSFSNLLCCQPTHCKPHWEERKAVVSHDHKCCQTPHYWLILPPGRVASLSGHLSPKTSDPKWHNSTNQQQGGLPWPLVRAR